MTSTKTTNCHRYSTSKTWSIVAVLVLVFWVLLSFECVATILVNEFDFEGDEILFGIRPDNFTSGYGGLLPSAGYQFFASGNGNTGYTFHDSGLTKNLGGTIEDVVYEIYMNIAWYNSGQNGGMTLSNFDELYIGSENGLMQWLYTPEPIIEDQWYTWVGMFTPAPSDIGQPWSFHMVYDLLPKRDIAIDFPMTGFARPIPEPSSFLLIGVILSLRLSIVHWHKVG